VPAVDASFARHGIGSLSAQSILTTGVSQVNRSRSSWMRAGTASCGSSREYSAGADTSATTARRTRMRAPPSVSTATARPPRTTIRATGAPVRIVTPAARARRARAADSSPAPPTGTGKPWCWPSIASIQP
jgi:hypothetical protein